MRLVIVHAFVPLVIDRPYLKELVMLFLLRLPSGGLPLVAHEAPAGAQVPVLSVMESEMGGGILPKKEQATP